MSAAPFVPRSSLTHPNEQDLPAPNDLLDFVVAQELRRQAALTLILAVFRSPPPTVSGRQGLDEIAVRLEEFKYRRCPELPFDDLRGLDFQGLRGGCLGSGDQWRMFRVSPRVRRRARPRSATSRARADRASKGGFEANAPASRCRLRFWCNECRLSLDRTLAQRQFEVLFLFLAPTASSACISIRRCRVGDGNSIESGWISLNARKPWSLPPYSY